MGGAPPQGHVWSGVTGRLWAPAVSWTPLPTVAGGGERHAWKAFCLVFGEFLTLAMDFGRSAPVLEGLAGVFLASLL